MGKKEDGSPFHNLRKLSINSEQMADDPKRLTIQEVNAFQFRNRLAWGVLPGFANAHKPQITRILNGIKNKHKGNSVDVMVFKINQDYPLWVCRPLDHTGKKFLGPELGESKLASLVETELDSWTFISIVCPALGDERRFADDFWDYQIQKCREKGIYWG